MKYQRLDKFRVTNKTRNIEIISCRPGAQGVRLTEEGVDYYDVLVDGVKFTLSENMLNLFVDKIEEPIIPISVQMGFIPHVPEEQYIEKEKIENIENENIQPLQDEKEVVKKKSGRPKKK